MNIPVFDLHCDTALALLGREDRPERKLYENDCHIDLKRVEKLAGYCQCFACFTTPFMQEWMKVSPVTVFEKELAFLHKALEENENLIRQALTAADVEENLNNGMMSAVFTIEGPAGFDFDPARLEDLYRMGFRITSLGWNEKNPLAGSHVSGGGLTDQGREYIKEAQRLGMIIDVSHISDEAFWDIMDVTLAPVIATHSNSRAVCNHSRNLTDEMFAEICKTCCDHFLHFMELDPDGKHIALGGDLDGVDVLPKGFTGIESYPDLADCLLERGLTKDNLHDIYWKNPLGVMKRCCM